MAYTTAQDVLTLLSSQQLAEALDDTGAGATFDSNGNPTGAAASLLNQIISTCSGDVDGRLANIYAVPFGNPPAKVKAATLIFVCEALAFRRLPPEVKNPFTERAEVWRKELTKIGHGELELDLNFPRAYYQGAAVVTPSKVNGSTL